MGDPKIKSDRQDLWEHDPISLCPVEFNLFATSERQRRLCACHLIRTIIWHILPADLQAVVRLSESFADGAIPRKKYFASTRAARATYKELYSRFLDIRSVLDRVYPDDQFLLYHALSAVDGTTTPAFSPTALRQTASRIWATISWWMEVERQTDEDRSALTASVKDKFAVHTFEFFEYIAAPFPTPTSWPSTIVALATAVYAGEEGHYALHDALLELGQTRMAQHFKTKSHPNGCWALDLIRGQRSTVGLA